MVLGDENTCSDCPENHYCDGSDQKINCESNTLNIHKCSGGNIQLCESNYILNSQRSKCDLCVIDSIDGFSIGCDGSQLYNCTEKSSGALGYCYPD